MKWLERNRMRLIVAGIVAVMVLGGGRANAVIIMSEPTNVGPSINDTAGVQECDFSHDGLELYLASGGIQVVRRETTESDWIERGPVIMSGIDPAISPNGLELYFDKWADWYLWVATRPSKDDPWGDPVKVGPPVGSYDAYTADVSADGLSLYFASYERSGGYGNDDLWVATRATIDDQWGEPVNLGPNINSSRGDVCPTISADGLTLVFSRGGPWSLWATTRKSVNDDWEPAVDLGINGPGYFYGPALSPDGSTIYFDASASWGGYGNDDLWQIKFIPIVDFNIDEIIDIADLLILIDHWGEEGSSFDIGPLPLGDGVVDEADLVVLMSHWGQEIYDPSLVAHWKLDEEEGKTAYDSVGANDGVVIGLPQWRPQDGIVNGALELNGTTFLTVNSVLSPSDGPFSVLAWVKGGAPGQVVVSQSGRTNWLMADAVTGTLRTELSDAGQDGSSLGPEAVITDGNWHRIALTWDSANVRLYVDGLLVAEYAQGGLADSSARLIFGTGKNRESGTFFSGLIDDIRIYNRVVSP